jgi:hypothetical protein
MTDSRTRSGGNAAVPPPAAVGGGVRAGRARAAVTAWTWCALGGGAGYVLRDRTAAAAGLAVAVVIVACAAVVLGAVLLGGRERRSPFVRFMLLVCVLTGRPPGEYLPPGPVSADMAFPVRTPGQSGSGEGGVGGGTPDLEDAGGFGDGLAVGDETPERG